MNSPRIQPLPLQLANQIAAGEVVERPASVVKELVENSIDAGASLVEIVTEGAGSQLIRVSDDGGGIHPDDLPLALSRHATSKLSSSEQLSQIASLGFRGEALPSISSVSALLIRSRQAEQSCGWQISGEQSTVEPTAHPPGTTVEVRDLFFNIPARRRFLRSAKTEQQHILTTLQRLALSRFDVAFKWQIDQSNPVKLPVASDGQQQEQRISKLCGTAFVRAAIYLEQRYQDIQLRGWLSQPQAHRAQTDVQYFFINGRVIRDRLIQHAIRQAYAALLPDGRQPGYVLYLTLPLDRVDVNVHPTKHEVRFRDARLLHGLITKAVQDALLDGSSAGPAAVTAPPEQVQDASGHYQSHRLADKPLASLSPHRTTTTSLQLIYQRYALLLQDSQLLLVDLQRAEQTLRKQQLLAAIASQNLLSRPVLVPLELPYPATVRQRVSDYQQLLEPLALRLKTGQHGLLVEAIPSLLAHADLRQLIAAVVDELQNEAVSIDSLSQVLVKQLPLIAVRSVEQAQQILQQIEPQPSIRASCYRILDQAALAGLFSAEVSSQD